MDTPVGSAHGPALSETTEISHTETTKATRRKAYIGIGVLFLVNLLNYIDRFTIAGVLDDIQDYYGLSKTQQGLLQTIFIVTYMLLAPLFGYLGDRYSRKLLMCVGIFFWALTTLLGSFIPQGMFWLFLVDRGLVGIGEASYSTIAPTIISDLFMGKMRSRMLGLFYFAIPVGSGLGFIIGSTVAKAAGGWWWALRVTPGFGFLSVVLLLIFLQDPPRGSAEGSNIVATTWSADMKALVANRSFIWSTLGFTCVAFVAGALSFWAPQFMMYAERLHNNDSSIDQTSVSLKFGIITVIAGILGVALGSFSSQYLRSRTLKADPLICAGGLLVAAPFLYFSILSSKTYPDLTLALVFFAEMFLCLNWPIVADMVLGLAPQLSFPEAKCSASLMVTSNDMLPKFGESLENKKEVREREKRRFSQLAKIAMLSDRAVEQQNGLGEHFDTLGFSFMPLQYVVLPPRRSSAEAFQILASHALGDAISPYIVGTVSDAIKRQHPDERDSDWNNWNGLQDALYITTFVAVLGSLCFVVTSWYIEKDKQTVDDAIKDASLGMSASTIRTIADPREIDFSVPRTA